MNAKKQKAAPEKSRKLKWLALAILVLLLMTGSVWAVGRIVEYRRGEAQLAEVEQKRKDLFNSENREGMTPEQRREQFQQLRDMEKALPEAQRKKLQAEREERMRQAMLKPAKEYFALPADQRDAYLDKMIEDEKARREQRAARRAQNGGNGGGRPPRPDGQQGGPPGQDGAAANQDPAASAKTAQDRDTRRRERLEHSTPVERAQLDAFRQAMAARREALGLPPGGGRGGGGGGGGRGPAGGGGRGPRG